MEKEEKLQAPVEENDDRWQHFSQVFFLQLCLHSALLAEPEFIHIFYCNQRVFPSSCLTQQRQSSLLLQRFYSREKQNWQWVRTNLTSVQSCFSRRGRSDLVESRCQLCGACYPRWNVAASSSAFMLSWEMPTVANADFAVATQHFETLMIYFIIFSKHKMFKRKNILWEHVSGVLLSFMTQLQNTGNFIAGV